MLLPGALERNQGRAVAGSKTLLPRLAAGIAAAGAVVATLALAGVAVLLWRWRRPRGTPAGAAPHDKSRPKNRRPGDSAHNAELSGGSANLEAGPSERQQAPVPTRLPLGTPEQKPQEVGVISCPAPAGQSGGLGRRAPCDAEEAAVELLRPSLLEAMDYVDIEMVRTSVRSGWGQGREKGGSGSGGEGLAAALPARARRVWHWELQRGAWAGTSSSPGCSRHRDHASRHPTSPATHQLPRSLRHASPLQSNTEGSSTSMLMVASLNVSTGSGRSTPPLSPLLHAEAMQVGGGGWGGGLWGGLWVWTGSSVGMRLATLPNV